MAPAGSRVLAVLVVTDGEEWLHGVLTGLAKQSHDALDVVAVDNGSTDGSRDVLLSYLDETQVLVAERDLGFPGAVSMALDARPDHELVLLVHDDTALAPDAVSHLVAALTHDPRLAIVGCKLVDWNDPGRLQSVGWSVDITGRADLGLEPDERDQGQRDEPRRPLVVSTAGMLFRRDVFEALGRFDRRYHVFRDDLDLCWRAWLAGWEVEVVPHAVARHVRAASNYRRLGQTVFLGPRYFAERNTLATLIKNYEAKRLAVVLPLFLVVGLAKIVGFVATRRVADAWQTLRAWAWNLLHLRQTLGERRRVQALRRRGDVELRPLFSKISPRWRAYAEALADRVTGGDLEVVPPPQDVAAEPKTVTARFVDTVQRHPVGVAAVLLVVLGILVALPLLPPGELRGGDFAPFPDQPSVFLEDYAASWHDASGVGTDAPPSPAQALLGFVHMATFGNDYLASRLLLLGAVPAAWLLSLRAAKPLTTARWPRVAAATLYALSPTALAASRTGRLSTLVVLVMLPAAAAGLYAMLRRDAHPASAWRATAATILASAVAIAFQPTAALGFVAVLVVAAVWVGVRPRGGMEQRPAWLRLVALAAGTVAVLFPWSLTLFRLDGPITAATGGATPEPLWRWLLQAPAEPGFAGVAAGAGAVAAGLFGLMVSSRRRPVVGLMLWIVALAGVVLATLSSREGTGAWLWPGLPLLLASAAFAGLFAIGLSTAARELAAHDFGWRQVGAGAMVLAAVVGVGATAVSLVADPWQAFVRGQPALPAFIGAAEEDGEFRVLTLADDEGAVWWDVTGPDGPTMVSYGVPLPGSFERTIDDAIAAVVAGADPGAAGRLGLLNVRYLYVPEEGRTPALERALASQLELEPQPVAAGLVYRVATFLPQVAWVPRGTIGAIERRGVPPTDVGAEPLTPRTGGRYTGEVPGDGAILLSETTPSQWRARYDGHGEVAAERAGPVVRLDVPDEATTATVFHAGQRGRSTAVLAQTLAVLLVLSLLLRPPGFAAAEVGR